MSRATPFDLLFSTLAEDRLPAIRASLAETGADARDRDAFLMNRDAIELVRELRPEGGMGEAIDQLVALVHHAFLFWAAGMRVVRIDGASLDRMLEQADVDGRESPAAVYAQLPELRVWAEVIEGEPHEPMDGCFVHETGSGELRVLGVFGVHPGRDGFTVVEAAGRRAERLARPEGVALFTPTLPGGAAAGLHSIAGEEELLELGFRARAQVA